jgi:hypothetical protein
MDSRKDGAPRRYKNGRQKLEAAGQLYWAAWTLKEAYLRKLHPDWSDNHVKKEVKDWMLYARS